VVIAERASGTQKPRIPDVCAGVGVKCLPLLGMFKERGWQFRSNRSVARLIRREYNEDSI
jgi:hypothetical protein